MHRAMTFAIVALLSAPIPARAQSILVTAGEHRGFTRLVLQAAQAIDWRLGGVGRGRLLTLETGEHPINLSRAFDRIGRTRLADLRRQQDGLGLELACDCRIEAWTERPGLVVLDIHDPAPASADIAPMRAPVPDLRAGPFIDPAARRLSQAAGEAIARAWQERDARMPGPADASPGPDEESPGLGAQDRDEVLHNLAMQVAGALGQGVLSAAPAPGSDAGSQIPATTGRLLGETPNLRVATVDQRPDLGSIVLPADPSGPCTEARTLDFVIADTHGAFSDDFARLMRDWVGEFDVAGAASSLALVRLYLVHGLGAEARALLDRMDRPVAGQDLLLGMGDLLENRPSNSRHQLSRVIACGGVSAMMAALAGAPAPRVAHTAHEIALVFSESPASLRSVIGARLAETLIDAEALEAARLVIETLKRGVSVDTQELALLEARLERGRGETERAADRLEQLPEQDATGLLTRLEFSLERGAPEPPEILEHAEALASTLRDTDEGARLMSAAIRHRIAAGAAEQALDPLDRLDRWSGAGAGARAQVAGLRDAVWRGIADQVDDAALITLAMAREDWRAPGLSAETRAAMGGRLLRFGFADLVAPLLEPAQTPALRHLLARLRLAQGDPQGALDALVHDRDEAAQLIRIEALSQRNATGAAVNIQGAVDAAAAAMRRGEGLDTPGRPRDSGEGAELTARAEPARAMAQDRGISPRPLSVDGGAPSTPQRDIPLPGAADADAGATPRGPAPVGEATGLAAAGPSSAPGSGAGALAGGPSRELSPADLAASPLLAESPADNERQRGARLLSESSQLRESLAHLLADDTAAPRP